jgi:hypothetical protein
MLIRKVSLSILSSRKKLAALGKISFMTLRKATMASLAGGALIATAPAAPAQTVNFHNANQGYGYYSGYNRLMYGQGAAVDPGNNVWNGFGQYGGPGSTDFYGTGNPNSNHGAVPANLPGNPYAWHSGTTASGTNLFSPTNSGAANVGNAKSDGTLTPVTISLTYGGDNGLNVPGLAGTVSQGTPGQILGEAALTPNGTTPGTFTLSNVPAGTYNLFLYGANYDGTRGAAFTVSSGTALGGLTSAINPGGGPLNSFILGGDYVEFTGVTPDGSGNITGTWSAVSNPISGLSGEGDFNGLQLQAVAPVPEPSSLVLCLVGGAAGVTRIIRRRRQANAASQAS